MKVEDVEELVGECLQERLDQVDYGENEIVALTCSCTPCSNANASSHRWVWAKGTD